MHGDVLSYCGWEEHLHRRPIFVKRDVKITQSVVIMCCELWWTELCHWSVIERRISLTVLLQLNYNRFTSLLFRWPAIDFLQYRHTYTYTRLTALFPSLPGWAGTRKVKPVWILLKQETVSGSGISWTICKSAPHSRQITTSAPHHSFFTGQMPFLPPNQQRQSTEGSTVQSAPKNHSLPWSIKTFLIFGLETFWKHDIKQNLSENSKTISAFILFNEIKKNIQIKSLYLRTMAPVPMYTYV